MRVCRRWRCVLLLLSALLLACASTPAPPPEPPKWTDARRARAETLAARLRETPGATHGLRVRLAFPADVDLDLYVTDPRLETVYYANTPIASGGLLEEDRRCSEAAGAGSDDVRIETVRFDAPLPGRYRIGVDFPHRCEGGPDAVAFAVSIEHGGTLQELAGTSRWLDFTPIVHEFDLP